MVLTTQKGYIFFEALSAFQKAIRRSEENVALYFAVELFNSNFDEATWNRMKIIVSEDIGLAEPLMAATIAALYQNYSDTKKQGKDGRPERIYFIHAVLLLVRAKKSRLADLYVVKLWREHEDYKMEVPDYAFDKHTMKGQKMGRGIDHFHTEGTNCTNFDPQPGEMEVREQAIALLKVKPNPITFPAREKKTKQGELL